MAETVETAIYRLRVEGQEQLGKLKSELDGVTVSEEKAAAASRTTTQALQNRLARLDPLIKAQQQYAKELEAATRFAQSGVGSDAQRAAQIDLATRRYNEQVAAINKVEQATGKFATQTGLARHEMINLSRQAQDVAVSLGSGQGFGTVLLQQGTQIMDILGTSQGGVRGALSGLAAGLRSVFTIGRVAFGGVIGGATAAAFAVSDYLDKQREAERSLIGAGRRSGASAADINQIGSAGASSTGFSVSEARSAALEFAKTGQVHKSVIGEMIQTTKNFAIITGQSGKEAAEALAKSFSDMRGIDALNKQFDFLSAQARRSIEDLFAQGQSSDAVAIANQRLGDRLKEVEGTLSSSEKGWRALTNAISNAWTATGEFLARAANLETMNIGDQINRIQQQIAETSSAPGLLGVGAQEEKLAKLRAELERLTAAKQKFDSESDFNKLETEAAQAVGALNPLTGKIRETENVLKLLKNAYEQGAVIPGLSEELNLRQQLLDKLNLQKVAQDELIAKQPAMNSEFAKQIESLEQQNRLLKARENGTEASVSAAIAYENAISAGATATEAAAIKSLTLKNNLLQAASAASDMTVQLGGSSQMEWDWDGYIAKKKAEDEAWRNGSKSIFAPDEMTQSGLFYTNDYLANAENVPSFLNQKGDPSFVDRLLNRSMDELKDAVDKNTEALNKVTLNPLYTQGRSALQLGYMHAATGLDFVAQGPSSGDQVPVHLKVNGGERVTVTPAGQSANDNSKTVIVNSNNYFSGSQSTMRRSERQLAQRHGQLMASLG